MVDLGPCLDEALLRSWESAVEQVNRLDRKDRGGILIARVEMRPLVRRSWFGEHPDDNPEEPGESSGMAIGL